MTHSSRKNRPNLQIHRLIAEGILTLITNKTGFNPRKSGSGYLTACPSHKDKHPSLSVTERDNKILFYCYSGCSFNDICSALNIKARDLFNIHKRGASYA